MAVREIIIDSMWDPEANVWVATSEDVPGLVLEAETLDGIIEEARSMVPELLRLNGVADDRTASLPCSQSHPERIGTRKSLLRNTLAIH